MRLRLLAAGAAVLVLAGCATPVVHPLATDPITPFPRPDLPVVDFPVTAAPRPIVLIGEPSALVHNVGSEGEKVAAENGRFSFTGVEPATPGPTPVALPDGPATLPVIGVRDAVTAMSAKGREGAPLELVSVEFGTAGFPTDRGRLELPAWLFRTSFGSVRAWPALAPEAFWRFGEVPHSMHRATTSDGVELEVQLPDPGPPCPGDEPLVMMAQAGESAVSVTVGLRQVSGDVGTCDRTLVHRSKDYAVTLAEPLGARLLVDEDNGVIPVTKR